MSITTLELAAGRLTRIGYLDVPVPAELLGLTPEVVTSLPWAEPGWARDGQPLLGAAAWIGELDGQRIAFDPLQTLDVLLRPDRDSERTHQDSVTALFAASGCPVESVDLVVLSHIDGVGMVARHEDDGSWSPFFPNARILLSEAELTGFLDASANAAEEPAPDLVREAWMALVDAGCVHPYVHGEAIAPGVTTDVSGGHGPGHAVVHFAGNGTTEFSLIGHLAVSPVHLATGECAALNEDPAAAWTLLHENAGDGRLIGGALWPTPGYGRWLDGALQTGGRA